MNQLHVPFEIATYSLSGFPTKAELGRFRVMLIVADAISSEKRFVSKGNVFSGENQEILNAYTHIGGSLITSCINMPSGANTTLQSYLFAIPLVSPGIYHNNSQYYPCVKNGIVTYTYGSDTTFVGAKGYGGYPDISLDLTKIDPVSNGALGLIWRAEPQGFGEYIYTYNGSSDSVCYNGFGVGIRYQGVSYNSIYLGFPLYFVQSDIALEVLRKAFTDCQMKLQ